MRTCLNTLARPSVMCRMPQGWDVLALGVQGLPSVHGPQAHTPAPREPSQREAGPTSSVGQTD